MFALIRVVSGHPVVDAVKLAFYRPGFYRAGGLTQEAMRGPSKCSVADRELMAAFVSKVNETEFCIAAHTATSAIAYNDGAKVSPTRTGRDPRRCPSGSRSWQRPHRNGPGLRQRAAGRRGSARVTHQPVGRPPGDEDLDQRLWLRRNSARLREKRPQAWRRPARPAAPPPGTAVGIRSNHGGLPRSGDPAR